MEKLVGIGGEWSKLDIACVERAACQNVAQFLQALKPTPLTVHAYDVPGIRAWGIHGHR